MEDDVEGKEDGGSIRIAMLKDNTIVTREETGRVRCKIFFGVVVDKKIECHTRRDVIIKNFT